MTGATGGTGGSTRLTRTVAPFWSDRRAPMKALATAPASRCARRRSVSAMLSLMSSVSGIAEACVRRCSVAALIGAGVARRAASAMGRDCSTCTRDSTSCCDSSAPSYAEAVPPAGSLLASTSSLASAW